MLQVRKTTVLSTLCLFLCSCTWTACGLNISTRCAQDALMFLTELNRSQPEKYAVLMYDALGKVGSDVDGGNVNRVGSLQECLSVKGPGFGGHYCQVFLKQGVLEYFVGVCVPDSCNEADVSALIVYGRLMLCLRSLSIRSTGVCSGEDNRKRWRAAMERDPLYVVSFSGPVYLAVDTFLLLGGLLSAKSFLSCIQKSDDKMSLRLIAHFLFRRFKRIQPLHLFIVCAIVALFSFLPKSPFWFMAEDQTLNCKEFWWSNLLLINNLVTITHTCAPWTWYLSVDFQFYMMTPFLIFLHRLESETYFEYYYNKPYTRLGPYLLGILAGIYIVTKKEDLIKHRWQAAAGWLVSLSIMALIVAFAYMLRGQGSPGHAVYQGLHRSLWALAVSWIIIACEEGYGGFVKKFLSMSVWVPLSNISFACYLVHPLLILLYNFNQQTLIHYTDLNFFYLFLAHSFLTVVFGWVLSMLIEKPYQLLSST
ncbi:O-acyltransferase like protein [Silurus meridionalis]|nr:O-acyltransferase like protein [Silurus meridionalis]